MMSLQKLELDSDEDNVREGVVYNADDGESLKARIDDTVSAFRNSQPYEPPVWLGSECLFTFFEGEGESKGAKQESVPLLSKAELEVCTDRLIKEDAHAVGLVKSNFENKHNERIAKLRVPCIPGSGIYLESFRYSLGNIEETLNIWRKKPEKYKKGWVDNELYERFCKASSNSFHLLKRIIEKWEKPNQKEMHALILAYEKYYFPVNEPEPFYAAMRDAFLNRFDKFTTGSSRCFPEFIGNRLKMQLSILEEAVYFAGRTPIGLSGGDDDGWDAHICYDAAERHAYCLCHWFINTAHPEMITYVNREEVVWRLHHFNFYAGQLFHLCKTYPREEVYSALKQKWNFHYYHSNKKKEGKKIYEEQHIYIDPKGIISIRFKERDDRQFTVGFLKENPLRRDGSVAEYIIDDHKTEMLKYSQSDDGKSLVIPAFMEYAGGYAPSPSKHGSLARIGDGGGGKFGNAGPGFLWRAELARAKVAKDAVMKAAHGSAVKEPASWLLPFRRRN